LARLKEKSTLTDSVGENENLRIEAVGRTIEPSYALFEPLAQAKNTDGLPLMTAATSPSELT
jgi:hypothetical protein